MSLVGYVLALSAAIALVPARGAGAGEVVFYVSPQGNDAWSGTLAEPNAAGDDGPFATIARAQRAVREARRGKQAALGARVVIRGGVYRLREPIVFRPEDSGTAEAPVIYEAYPGERPVLSGGRVISGWRKGEGELWVAEIAEVRAGKWYFHQLFVNGKRRTRARAPNEGYLYTAGPLPEIANPRRDRRDAKARIGFRYKNGDIRRWEGLEDANIVLFHAWTASVHWIASLDEKQHTVRFTAPSQWPVGWWERTGQRYYVENFREALDAPGEWYLERKTGKLYYWPAAGEDVRRAEVVAPVLEELVRFEGEPEAGRYVEHIVLRGLSFQHAAWKLNNDGDQDGQAAAALGAAIYARGARRCALERCEVAHVGEYGVWLGEGCKRNRIVHCEIHDLGAGGVKLGETRSARTEALAAEGNVVDNCFIHDGGHVFHAGVGVWVGRSSYNEVTHNEICDFDYTGVSVGWSWGYAPSSAHDNIVEYNHIHDIGRGVLSDMGGIYTLGVSPGTRLRFNVIHDVYSYSYGGWGLYTDEGSTGILLEKNVVYNTKTGGFHQHYGKENIVRNNIFAFAQSSQINRSREEEHLSFRFERNIVYCDRGEILGGVWEKNFYMDYNLYWVVGDEEEIDFYGLDFADWQARGHDRHSLVADPKFVDPEHYDFRLRPDSPAFGLGIEPIDTSAVGLYGEEEWVFAPRRIVRAPVSYPPPPGEQPIRDDFEQTAVGEPPRLARVFGEEKGAGIRVSDERAASGKQSLKFRDAPGLSKTWQPHLVYQPRFASGVAKMSFDLWLGPGAMVLMEWRDSARPYRVGPSLRIEADGTLVARGKPLMRLPREKWVRFEIVCPLGRRATGKYDLTITVSGGQPRKFAGLATGSEKWRRLMQLVFVSLADAQTEFYLDNLRVERSK